VAGLFLKSGFALVALRKGAGQPFGLACKATAGHGCAIAINYRIFLKQAIQNLGTEIGALTFQASKGKFLPRKTTPSRFYTANSNKIVNNFVDNF